MITKESLKTQLGGIQGKMEFSTLEPFANFAERWFREQVGPELMGFLADLREPQAGSDEADLLYLAHSCLSWKCYEMAFPHLKFRAGDLGLHKVNSQSGIAISKWEYVDSREANLAMLDIALENFWQAVEQIKPDAWLQSTAYQKRQRSFIRSASELAEQIPTLGRKHRLFEQVLVYVRRAEQLYLRPVLTESVYLDLKAAWSSPVAILMPKEEELLDKIRPALAHLALFEAYPYLPLTLDTSGITESRSKDGTLEQVAPSDTAKSTQKRQLYQDGQFYLAEVGQFLRATASASLFGGFYQKHLANPGQEASDDFTNSSLIIL